MLNVVNISVMLFALVVLGFKVRIFLIHKNLMRINVISAIVAGYVISDFIDLLCTTIFAMNSGLRSLFGFDEETWNNISAELGVVLRLMIISSSLLASVYADRICKRNQEEIQRLCDESCELIKG